LSLLDDAKIFLPKYLSDDETTNLFVELNNFPDNIDSRLFSKEVFPEKTILQGDGINEIKLANIGTSKFYNAKVLCLSNSCDISNNNQRLTQPYVVVSPIISLEKHSDFLKGIHPETEHSKIDDHILDIKNQKVSNCFYIPEFSNDIGDCFARFDMLQSFPASVLPTESLASRRLFSLSNYGWYLMLVKLSIHFTRVRESIDRGH